jgi:hypothetical protein
VCFLGAGVLSRRARSALKAWLVVLAFWTGGLYVVFALKSANGGAGLAWGLIAGGVKTRR